MPETRKKVMKGVAWSLTDTFANFAVKFFFALAITRLLTPRDYGLMAYTGLFMGIAAWLADAGFGNALIQKKDADDTDFSTAYTFQVGVSVILFVVYFFSSPAIARYFHEPELELIIKVTSLNLIINSLSAIHLIRLIREIHFRSQTILNFITSISGGVIGILLALKGYGYWALVFQTMVSGFLNTLGLFFIVKWRPKLLFSIRSFSNQFRFGSRIFLQGLFESIFREIYSLVIGKNYRTVSLGNYSRGQKFFDLFIVQTGTAVNKVLYPALVKHSGGELSSRRIYIKIYNLLFFVIAPVSLFLIFLSEPLTVLLLTEKWIHAVPFMQLYFAGGFIYVLIYFNSTTVLSSNRPNLFLMMDITQKLLLLTALVFTYTISIKAIIVGWLLVYYFYYFIYEKTMHRLNYTGTEKYVQMLQVLICLIPSALLYILSVKFITSPLIALAVNVCIQPLVYFFIMRISGFSVYRLFSDFVKPMLPPRFQAIF